MLGEESHQQHREAKKQIFQFANHGAKIGIIQGNVSKNIKCNNQLSIFC
jgi:hypothetical protein